MVPEALQTVKDVYHIYEDGIILKHTAIIFGHINVETVDKILIKYSTNDKSKLFII